MSKPLRIAIDVRDLRIAKTGTGTYLTEICREFRRLEGSEFRFYFLDTPFPVYTGENKLLKLVEHLRFSIWKQIGLPILSWINRCDIVFCTDYFVPYIHLNFRTVAVFHDAFFFEHPEYYNKIWLSIFRNLALPAARRAAVVIAPTNYARERIQAFAGIEECKLKTVYEGPKSFSTPVPHAKKWAGLEISERLKGCPYILHVGIMNKRKNLPALISAFKLLKASNPTYKLVLAGKSDPKKYSNDDQAIAKAIADNQLEDDVILAGYLTDSHLAYLYKGASLYVFPSLNEGFGIPVIEAFTYRLPVLVANNSCLPEVGGDAVLTFNPHEPGDIFRAMKTVLEDEALRNAMVNAGQQRLTIFTWKNTARQLLDVFTQVARKS